MGLSTHVLDTAHGCPAAGMTVTLYTTANGTATQVKQFNLNSDGRNPDGPLYDNAGLQKGTYRLVFDVAGYFRAKGVQLPDPPFLDQVSIDFGVAHTDQHYHVPLVCTPWTYSTYRGS
ncbi:MAG: hydroxyisourate hydrolase [Ramlibacter sp.]